jgi:NAD(P)-dependent dehydrogenase (short-subunit alcohol dehydrogenase family)
MMTLDFTGKNAIIVGAASGIGKGIAMQFAKNNANVWVGDLSVDKGQKTIKEMEKYGGAYGFTKTDVSKKADIAALFEDAKKAFDRIDIVVNSAGVFAPVHLLDASPEYIQKHLTINLFGVIYGCQIALETMIKQGGGGKILNVASVGGRKGELDFPFYSLGKAGVLNFTQSVAFNAAQYGINVNALCPGIIRTPMWDTILNGIDPNADKEQLFKDVVLARTPLGRAQTAEEMGYAAAFLCSSYADVITGQALNVDGGSVMS